MSDAAREAILATLRAVRRSPGPASGPPPPDFSVLARKTFPIAERYPRLRRMMEAVKAEFLEATEESWPRAVHELARSNGMATLLYGPGTPDGGRLAANWPQGDGPRLVPYDRPVEEIKSDLFEKIDAGFTTTRGGIAETGGLIIWPSPEEPRLLSLVPPVHVALLRTDFIFDTFHQAIAAQGWAADMPRNALLVAGPSKTADIEQTLAYGVHGPKRLVVVVIKPEP